MSVNIKFDCAFDRMVKVNELIPNPANPNQHPEEQIELFARVIEYQGWREAIVVSKRSGMIVKGHGRLLVAKYLGLEEVPVDFQDYESETMELADMMSDNRLAEMSYIDKRRLLNLFEEFDTGEVEFELSGYNDEFYRDLAHAFDEYEKKEEKEEEIEVKKTMICPSCGHEIEV